jgi:hypothetical protein
MADKKKFLLRLDEELYAALEKWAADDLRSVNAEMEFLLKEAARKAGRLKAAAQAKPPRPDPGGAPDTQESSS